MPWRNGLGITLEIAREPSVGDDFLWRLSLATIATSGPFSAYPGYQRSITLIAGNGFRLDIDAQPPALLCSVGASVSFAGEASTNCMLINGPCTDLSLMVREPGAILSVSSIKDVTAPIAPPLLGTLRALFCLAGETILTLADQSSRVESEIMLTAHDTVLVKPQVEPILARASSGVPVDLLLLTWSVARAAQA
jgi:environmental stress-induced protein Ves